MQEYYNEELFQKHAYPLLERDAELTMTTIGKLFFECRFVKSHDGTQHQHDLWEYFPHLEEHTPAHHLLYRLWMPDAFKFGREWSRNAMVQLVFDRVESKIVGADLLEKGAVPKPIYSRRMPLTSIGELRDLLAHLRSAVEPEFE